MRTPQRKGSDHLERLRRRKCGECDQRGVFHDDLSDWVLDRATSTCNGHSAREERTFFCFVVQRQEMRCGAPKSARSRCRTGRRRQTVSGKRSQGVTGKRFPSQRGSRTFPRRLGVCVASRGAHAGGDENLRGGDNRCARVATGVSRRVKLSAAGCTRSKKSLIQWQGDARRQRLQPPPMTLADALHEMRLHEARFVRSYQIWSPASAARYHTFSRVSRFPYLLL